MSYEMRGGTSAEMNCPRCQCEYANGRPEHFGSDPKCAFTSGSFDAGSHNWQCATANALRGILYKAGEGDYPDANCLTEAYGLQCFRCCWDDQSVGLIFCENTGWIHLGWYKNRGATEMITDEKGRPLSLEMAEQVLEVARVNGWKDSLAE